MKRYLLTFFLFAFHNVHAQENLQVVNTDSLQNRLQLTVVDVVERTNVTGFSITVFVGYDTIHRDVNTAQNFSLRLYPGMSYSIIIAKSGYDTLRTEWTHPADTADVYVDFYMRKNNLSKAERKKACRKSQQPIRRTTKGSDEGGFRILGPSRKQVCETRVDIFGKNFSESTCVYVNHKYLK